ncbi:cyclopropane-fatty-acyl-phospholipid synthase family protein [Streptomonospora sp. DSM 45055]|uniref:Cyclopropane-fatty-acyl-phospholipid synthase family protein n=2 Tax=Streptomonospora wellingtoniae TaxID=3075544 RepID=A0ABU2KNR7_9ACTN|nr:cyclopropane-fatty-acyl-phospholipid synthase family protein [Streptomonospora sp. DSM 45055]MDT0300921.1 cyclopropane-fatty-acyl-phospholipid synthase family protein [Streptomonospora sp. DSM 45055]
MLVPAAAGLFGGRAPVRVRAWDGSEAGPEDAVTVVLRDRAALRRVLARPDELGLARAYVSGEIDVEGDLTDALARVFADLRDRGPFRPRPAALARAAHTALVLGAVGAPPPPPAAEARLSGRRHSRRRDADAVSHHYDAGNELYRMLLDPSMAYSCAYWSDACVRTLDQAQNAKLDLVCRKLALRPGARLLDLGCGWGSLALHAAEHHGARVTALTLSAEQAGYVRARVAERGLHELVEVREDHYRDFDGEGFDAVAVIEMGEHVGRREYRAFAGRLRALLAPHGRLLVQQMSRRGRRPGGGPFIETYIAPDMHMRPVGRTVERLERAGLEVRDVHALREHYVRTARAWAAELERRWDEVAALMGAETARVWRLYLAGGALAFEEGRMGVDQILAVRRDPAGRGGAKAPLDGAAAGGAERVR